MRKIVFATNNEHKIREIRDIIGRAVEILSLKGIGCHEELPETQTTLEGNALQKARYVFDHYGLECFADDTGLEVEALDGRPGVYSARYAGPQCSFEDNIDKLLTEMKGIDDRRARFRTVIAWVQSGKESLFEGQVEGRIGTECRGEGGFGYDPVFFPDGREDTFAEMTSDEKNAISHRRLAVDAFATSFLAGQ